MADGAAEPLVAPSEVLRTQPFDWDSSPVMRGLLRLRTQMVSTSYVHGTDVDVRRGYFAFDCSSLVEWVLRDSTAQAYSDLRRGLSYRPLARDFVNYVSTLPPRVNRNGWKRVERVVDAQPGDIIAWLKPKFIKSENTGHVAVIVLAPRLRSPHDTAYVMRIADSSRIPHEDDSRGGQPGFGYGTILIETNPANGAPTGFSFAGSRAAHAFGSKIVIGRPLR